MARPATSRLKVNPPIGLRPSLENCRIFELLIDEAYQRSIDNGSSQALIRKIAMYWDWSLFHPLAVARRADGTLFVVDGQHRLAAAKLRKDLYDIPCVVTASASVADEAASFVAMNVQRRALSAIDLFKAAVAAGDDNANEITAMMAAAGLTLAPHQNFISWKPGMVSNIGGIRDSYKRFGRQVTQWALEAVARAFDGQVLRYGGTIFGAVAQYLHDDHAAESFDFDLFVGILAGYSQAEWVKAIASEQAVQGIKRQVAGALVLRTAYAEATSDDDGDEAEAA